MSPTEAEKEVPPTEVTTTETHAPDPDLDAEVAAVAVDGKVPLSTFIGIKRALKAADKRVKELEPVAARVTELDGRLDKAQPIIDAVLTNPKLRAEAIRIANGSRPSGETTAQPEDDQEAREAAEDYGYYLGDGTTPDAARARRVMNRQAALIKRETAELVKPFAGLVLDSRANANVQQVLAETDDAGTPIATAESVREVAAMLPPNLLASPEVVKLMRTLAIGVDHEKGRTPKPLEQPLYLERAGSGDRRRAQTYTSEDKRLMTRLGLTDKDVQDAEKRMEKSSGRGVRLE